MWNWTALLAVSGISERPPTLVLAANTQASSALSGPAIGGLGSGNALASGASAGLLEWGPLTVDLAHFTPWLSLAGGLLVGLSAVLVLWLFGQTAGISGLTAAVARGDGAEGGGWKVGLLLGLVGSGAAAAIFAPHLITSPTNSWGLLAIAGICVGLGTRTSGGCTSGHGVCGLGRARPRSAVAVVVFMAFGALTVWVLGLLGGAA